MEKLDFLAKVQEQYQDTDPNTIKLESPFKEFPEWGSLVALCLIAMVDESYGKTITGDELVACNTVEDIYQLVSKK